MAEGMIPPKDYERRDINTALFLWITLIGLVVVVILIFSLETYFIVQREHVVYEQQLKPIDERIIKLEEAEVQLMSEYRKIDTGGVVSYRIPVDSAMALVLDSAGTP